MRLKPLIRLYRRNGDIIADAAWIVIFAFWIYDDGAPAWLWFFYGVYAFTTLSRDLMRIRW